MADETLDSLLRALTARLQTGSGQQTGKPGAGSGIPRPVDMDSPDANKARAARQAYVKNLTDGDMTRLSVEEKKIVRAEIDAVLKDSGFGA